MDTDTNETEDKVLKKNQVLLRFFWYQLWVCIGIFLLVFAIPSTLLAVTAETNGFGVSLTMIGIAAGLTVIRWIAVDWMKMRLYNNILKQFDANPDANVVKLKETEAPTEK